MMEVIPKLSIIISILTIKTNAFILKQAITKRESYISILQSSPNTNEIAQQQKEAFDSLFDYHNNCWVGTSKSFTLSMKKSQAKKSLIENYKESTAYECNVRLVADDDVDDSSYGLLQESYNWENNKQQTMFSSRTLSLNEKMDVDCVDASYSHDFSQVNFPFDLSGITENEKLTFGIEQCLAVSHTQRIRCFLIYGSSVDSSEPEYDDDELLRVVICNEKLKNPKHGSEPKGFGKSASSSSSSSKSSDPTSIPIRSFFNSEEDLLDQLKQRSASSSSTSSQDEKLSIYPMTIFGLVSGVWLGDVIIRTTSLENFASWSLGVQKCAISWSMGLQDSSSTTNKSIRQRLDIGRSLGTPIAADFPTLSIGTIVQMTSKALAKILKKKNQSQPPITVLDFEMGEYAAFLLDGIYMKAPRKLSRRLNFHTDFSVFLTRDDEENQNPQGNDKQVTCSKLTRLYNNFGLLCQATSSFYTFKRFTT